MTDDQRHIAAEQMLASIRGVLREVARMSRDEWRRRSDTAQWHVMQALVAVGMGVTTLFWLVVQYPDPWWWRAQRLGYGVNVGGSRLDAAYLWQAIPRDWPRLERQRQQMLDDNPTPVPHGWEPHGWGVPGETGQDEGQRLEQNRDAGTLSDMR